MATLMLSLHVLAAILTIGPIAVAASLFPRYARRAISDADDPGTRAVGVAAELYRLGVAGVLHRICCWYAVIGLAVPVFGIATGSRLGVLTDAWLIVSLVLTIVAAAVLGVVILPDQRRLLTHTRMTDTDTVRSAVASRLMAFTGIFNALWAVVVVLMIVRPGSTTSV